MTARERMKAIRSKRSKETTKKRSERKTSYSFNSDPMYSVDCNVIKASEIKGDFNFRILPPTFESSDGHWGFEIQTHYQVGINNKSFNCPKKMSGRACPICEDIDSVTDPKLRKPLYPSYGVLVYVIDREDEKSGVQLWRMPFGVENDILTQSSRNEISFVDDEDEGFDITISYNTSKGDDGRDYGKWGSCTIDRKESPLSDDDEKMDEWLDFVNKNPLDKISIVYPYEKIANCYNGVEEIPSENSDNNSEKSDKENVKSKMKQFRKF